MTTNVSGIYKHASITEANLNAQVELSREIVIINDSPSSLFGSSVPSSVSNLLNSLHTDGLGVVTLPMQYIPAFQLTVGAGSSTADRRHLMTWEAYNAMSGSLAPSLQQSYAISSSPQIVTTTALGALEVKRGSTSDTDSVFSVLNGAGSVTASITGNGFLTLASDINILVGANPIGQYGIIAHVDTSVAQFNLNNSYYSLNIYQNATGSAGISGGSSLNVSSGVGVLTLDSTGSKLGTGTYNSLIACSTIGAVTIAPNDAGSFITPSGKTNSWGSNAQTLISGDSTGTVLINSPTSGIQIGQNGNYQLKIPSTGNITFIAGNANSMGIGSNGSGTLIQLSSAGAITFAPTTTGSFIAPLSNTNVWGSNNTTLITGSATGTLTFAVNPVLPSQTANTIYAPPANTSGSPSFRAMVGTDIPAGIVPLTSLVNQSVGGFLGHSGTGSSALVMISSSTSGQVPIIGSTSALAFGYLTSASFGTGTIAFTAAISQAATMGGNNSTQITCSTAGAVTIAATAAQALTMGIATTAPSAFVVSTAGAVSILAPSGQGFNLGVGGTTGVITVASGSAAGAFAITSTSITTNLPFAGPVSSQGAAPTAWNCGTSEYLYMTAQATAGVSIALTGMIAGTTNTFIFYQGASAQTLTFTSAGVTFHQTDTSTVNATGVVNASSISTINQYYTIKLDWATTTLCFYHVD